MSYSDSANGGLVDLNHVRAHQPSTSSATKNGPADQNPPGTVHRIRLVPHLESPRSFPFEPIMREVIESAPPVRVGRLAERDTTTDSAANTSNPLRIAFRSKVVARKHAEIWVEGGGKFFIKDTSSSSGTFLNDERLADANAESQPFRLRNGDIIQLGIDYQGGEKEMYRCVIIKVEIDGEWQNDATTTEDARAPTSNLTASASAATAVLSPNALSGGRLGLPLARASQPRNASASDIGVTQENSEAVPVTVHRIRLVPYLETSTSFTFEPIVRDAIEGGSALRVGRFTDRYATMSCAPSAPNASRITFRSKVVSRCHAEIWVEEGGRFFIKDTSSSSGTFLNHARLANANVESRPFPLKDSDIIQLGIDYQGGQQELYRCVKIKVEIDSERQNAANNVDVDFTAEPFNLKAKL